MKVLVVDDSTFSLNQIKEILEKNGHKVDTADNGSLALDRYVKFEPDLVTLDVSMPLMDGIETLRRLLKIDKSARVVMISARQDFLTVEKCLDTGALGFMTKPFPDEKFIERLQHVLRYSSNKELVLFLLLTCDILEQISYNLVGINVVCCLKDYEIIDFKTISQKLDLQKIRSVKEPFTYKSKIPIGYEGHVTEIFGQQKGKIITFVKSDKLNELYKKHIQKVDHSEKEFLDAVEIFHGKVFSEISNIAKLRIDQEVTRLFDPDSDLEPKEDITIGRYEVIFKDTTVPVELHLHFNANLFFRDTF